MVELFNSELFNLFTLRTEKLANNDCIKEKKEEGYFVTA